jgi:hypothetical protein
MLREERELLADLKRVCDQAPGFALEFMAGDMPIADEEAYAHRLVDVAEMIMLHARARKRLVIDGQATAWVLEPRPPMPEPGE